MEKIITLKVSAELGNWNWYTAVFFFINVPKLYEAVLNAKSGILGPSIFYNNADKFCIVSY